MDVKVSTRNITRAYRQASAEERTKGHEWYAAARREAEKLDPDNPARAAAVIAVLSPQVSWPRNLRLAADAYAGRELRAVTHRNAGKARAILAGADPEDIVSGPKVRAFWRTIVDPSDPRAVVIDRHAVDVAVGRVTDDRTRDRLVGRRGGYDVVADAYRRAARALSRELGIRVSPAQVQAVTWTHWRNHYALANHGG